MSTGAVANPFEDDSLTNHPSVEAKPADGNPFNDPALASPESVAAQTGQVTNDVGNTVIVPKDGESFGDTMRRAAAYGKTVTQDQINKEMVTAPGKVATTLAAAPVIGAGGVASMTGIHAGAEALYDLAYRHLVGTVPGLLNQGGAEVGEDVLKNKLLEMAPKALQIVKDWALPASAVPVLLKVLSMSNKK